MKKIKIMIVVLLLAATSYGQTIYEQVASLTDSVNINVTNKTVLNKVKAVDEGRMMTKTLGLVRNLRDSLLLTTGAMGLQQVLTNGNTTTSSIVLKVPGTLNKTCVNISTGIVKVQDTSGVNYVQMFQPFIGGTVGAKITFGYLGYANNILAFPTVNSDDTLPNKSGTFALTSDARYDVVVVGDSAYTLAERKCGGVVLMLSTVTVSRELTLFQANKCPGCHIEVYNSNASAFDRRFISNLPKAADGSDITVMNDQT